MKVYNEKEDQVLNLNDEVLSQLISTILDENYKLIEGLIKEQLEINVFNKLDDISNNSITLLEKNNAIIQEEFIDKFNNADTDQRLKNMNSNSEKIFNKFHEIIKEIALLINNSKINFLLDDIQTYFQEYQKIIKNLTKKLRTKDIIKL